MAEIGAGELGGAAVALAAIWAAAAKPLRWFRTCQKEEQKSRAEKLDVWHKELDAREKALQDRLDAQMADMQAQIGAITEAVDRYRRAFGMVASELFRKDPSSPTLLEARQILAKDFPIHLPTH